MDDKDKRMTPEEVELNASLNHALHLTADMAVRDALYQDRSRIKHQLVNLASFHKYKRTGVIPLEDALGVVDNELMPLPNKSGKSPT